MKKSKTNFASVCNIVGRNTVRLFRGLEKIFSSARSCNA